jgi:hypothetical protein
MRFALILAILVAGCTPAARPYGIAAGLAMSAIGAGLLIDAKTTSCAAPPKSDDPLDGYFSGWETAGCELGAGLETVAGATILIPSAILLLAALASPPAEPPRATTTAPPPPPPLDPSAPMFSLPRHLALDPTAPPVRRALSPPP